MKVISWATLPSLTFLDMRRLPSDRATVLFDCLVSVIKDNVCIGSLGRQLSDRPMVGSLVEGSRSPKPLSNLSKLISRRGQNSTRASLLRFVIGVESKKICDRLPESARHSVQFRK